MRKVNYGVGDGRDTPCTQKKRQRVDTLFLVPDPPHMLVKRSSFWSQVPFRADVSFSTSTSGSCFIT